MELLTQLELVDVTFDGQKAVLTFLHAERGEIREINFNKQVFNQDTNKWVDDADKAEKVEGWSIEYFDLPFDRLAEAIGERKDIFAYDKFNSLFEVEIVEKFEKDDKGLIFETQLTEVTDDGKAIRMKFEYEGKTYESKMSYADYMEARKEWFVNPVKKNKQYAKFEDKFGIPVSDMKQLEGRVVMVEVKVAFDKFPFAEIKPFPKKKK